MSADARAAPQWRICPDAAALAEAAAAAVAGCAADAIRRRGSFRIALAGGRSPRALYRQLQQLRADWRAWHIYFGDERCVPRDDPARNDRMAEECWLASIAIPRVQVHPIPAERGPEDGARAYAALLAQTETLDLAVLGIGEDGHTASLFPGAELGEAPDAPLALAVRDAPKPPAERVSLSLRALNTIRHHLVLAAGPAKRRAISQWQAGALLPVARLAPPGTLLVFLTRDAAPTSLSSPNSPPSPPRSG